MSEGTAMDAPGGIAPRSGGQAGGPVTSAQRGFTLIELVLAVGLLGGAFVGLLLLRASAVDRAFTFNTQRTVERVAQEKLDEVVFGIETQLEGSIEEHPDWSWEVQVYSVATTDSITPLLEANLTLTYPSEGSDEPQEYHLSTRFFADENHPLAEYGITGTDDGADGIPGGF